jgi:hypothetical protein
MPQEQKDDSVAELCRRLFSSNLKDDESVEEPRISTDHEVALTKSRAVISSESVRQHWAPQFEPNLLLSTSTTSTRKGKETLRLEPLQRAEYFPSLLSSSSTTSKVGPCVGVPQSLNLCAQSTSLEPNGRQLSTTTVEGTTRQGERICCMKPATDLPLHVIYNKNWSQWHIALSTWTNSQIHVPRPFPQSYKRQKSRHRAPITQLWKDHHLVGQWIASPADGLTAS